MGSPSLLLSPGLMFFETLTQASITHALAKLDLLATPALVRLPHALMTFVHVLTFGWKSPRISPQPLSIPLVNLCWLPPRKKYTLPHLCSHVVDSLHEVPHDIAMICLCVHNPLKIKPSLKGRTVVFWFPAAWSEHSLSLCDWEGGMWGGPKRGDERESGGEKVRGREAETKEEQREGRKREQRQEGGKKTEEGGRKEVMSIIY